MPRQIQTALAVVRELQAQGIPVHMEPGWDSRGSSTFNPRGLVVHHTADGPGEYPSLRIVRDGRSDLPGPLAQWGLGRSGQVYLIAAGRANHAGRGGWRGLSGNTSVWGIEAESTGRGDWTTAQRRSYPRLAAALARHQPFSVDMICAHREWTPRKPDPAGIDMPSFRAEVARLLHGAPSPAPTPIEEDEDDMRVIPYTVEIPPDGKYHPIPFPPPGRKDVGKIFVSFASVGKDGEETPASRCRVALYNSNGIFRGEVRELIVGRGRVLPKLTDNLTDGALGACSVLNRGPQPITALVEMVPLS